MDIKKELQSILNQKGYQNYVKGLKNNTELTKLLQNKYGKDLSLNELFYCGLNDYTESHCEFGCKKSFKNLKEGFRKFCGVGKQCQCRINSQSEKIKENYKNLSITEKSERLEKRKATSLTKYGVDNHMKTEKYKQKFRDMDHTTRIENAQKTYKEKTGYNTPLENPEIRNQAKITSIKRYGKLMTHARKALYEKYDGNPFSNVAIQTKIKNILQEKYGCDYPNQSKDIQKTLTETFMERYGVENASQLHISPESFSILHNKEKLIVLFNNESINNIANILNVSKSYLYSRLKAYDIIDNCQSHYEQEICAILDLHNIKYKKNDRTIISPKEIDFLLPDYNIGIEFCGLYWHSESSGNKDRLYHYNKWFTAKEKGITLYTIFEDEWNSGLWESRILTLTNTNSLNKIHARKCKINYIGSNMANKFLLQNHLQGAVNSKWYIGAYFEDALVGVMAFTKNRANQIELTRFCSTNNALIRGLASKMLSFFSKTQNINSIISFSDNRYSDGGLYKSIGFKKSSDLPPDYQYIIGSYTKRYHKFNFSKTKISLKFGINSSDTTEKEIMKLLGYDRIWDCGKTKWMWQKESGE